MDERDYKAMNEELNQPSCLGAVISSAFVKDDRVAKDNENGTVWKVSDKGVHVRYDNGMFEIFHFKPYHHKQTSIDALRHCL